MNVVELLVYAAAIDLLEHADWRQTTVILAAADIVCHVALWDDL